MIVIFGIILVYFYTEIGENKQLLKTIYQKVQTLEMKINTNQKTNSFIKNLPMKNQRIESPAFSITYQSDAIKNNNLSVKYSDLSETEAKELTKKLDKTYSNDNKIINNSGTEIIDIKLVDVVKQSNNTPLMSERYQLNECGKILEGLSNDIINIKTDDDIDLFDNNNIDISILKSITESLRYADNISDKLSDIPITSKKHVSKNMKTSVVTIPIKKQRGRPKKNQAKN
uniref:Uncharacterized protein n=1 Tax=viral metagenome TaxID=1070528 RepID=A0A6C0LUX2_9ZZZZ